MTGNPKCEKEKTIKDIRNIFRPKKSKMKLKINLFRLRAS